MAKTRIEILYFDACPNHEAAEELVRDVVAAHAFEVEVVRTNVKDSESAERARFLGSPTIRVAGRDIEPGADARTDFQLACRVYRTSRGLRGYPDERLIRNALAEANAH